MCSQYNIIGTTWADTYHKRAINLTESNISKNVQQSSEQPFLKAISSHCWCTPAAINALRDFPKLIPNEK